MHRVTPDESTVYVWGSTAISSCEAQALLASGEAQRCMHVDWPPEDGPDIYLLLPCDPSELGYCPYCGHDRYYGLILPEFFFRRCPKCREPGK